MNDQEEHDKEILDAENEIALYDLQLSRTIPALSARARRNYEYLKAATELKLSELKLKKP